MSINKGVLAAFAVLTLIIALTFGGWAWRYYTAEIKGVVGQEEQVQSPLHRMGAYERFYSLCASVKGHEATLKAQQELLDQTDDPAEKRRVRANLAGIAGQRARVIEEYNSRARMEHTQGQFRGSDLPYQLTIEGESTTC